MPDREALDSLQMWTRTETLAAAFPLSRLAPRRVGRVLPSRLQLLLAPNSLWSIDRRSGSSLAHPNGPNPLSRSKSGPPQIWCSLGAVSIRHSLRHSCLFGRDRTCALLSTCPGR